MEYQFRPEGVCSQMMTVNIEDGMLVSLSTLAGCSGNLQGIAQLAKGRPVTEVIELLKGVKCGTKATSCPEQLALGLEKILAGEIK